MCASVHTSGGQERTLSALLNSSLPYSFETGSLTKPKAKPEVSKPQQSSCICSSSVPGVRVYPGFLHGSGDLNPGPYGCITNALITPPIYFPSPQSCTLTQFCIRERFDAASLAQVMGIL